MNLQEARAEVKAVLEAAGIRAFVTLPEKASPPYAIVTPDEPYLDIPEQGGTINKPFAIHLIVLFLVKKGTNEKVMNELDAIVNTAIPALQDAKWKFTSAGAPGQQETNEAALTGIFIEKYISLQEGA